MASTRSSSGHGNHAEPQWPVAQSRLYNNSVNLASTSTLISLTTALRSQWYHRIEKKNPSVQFKLKNLEVLVTCRQTQENLIWQKTSEIKLL